MRLSVTSPRPLAVTVRYAEELLHPPPPPPPPPPPAQCVHVQESLDPAGSIAKLSCDGVSRTSTIKAIAFASFGTASGSCVVPVSSGANTFKIGGCNAHNTTTIVQKLCLGKPSCQVPSSVHVFGEPCHHVHKWLDIAVQCNENEHRDAAVVASVAADPLVRSLLHTSARVERVACCHCWCCSVQQGGREWAGPGQDKTCETNETDLVGLPCFDMRTGSRYEDKWTIPAAVATSSNAGVSQVRSVQNHEYIEGRFGELLFNDTSITSAGAHSSKLTVSCSHSFSQSNSVPYVQTSVLVRGWCDKDTNTKLC